MNANIKSLLKHYRLSRQEYLKIQKLLNHPPSRLELALFSALWSEHCSYKSSIKHLKKLYFDSPKVVSARGENAGVVDLGQGEKIAFKIESHNHPSRIMPYQGAGTGVGGILRDVFIMNARPIALADYLCFGEPSVKHSAELVDGVVRGIGGYGNCIGIPIVTGRTCFHSSYNENILVNALALGYFGPKDKVMTSKACGPGNLLVYAGASTGRDGIHGASMASKSFTASRQNLSNKTCVQIGDPFYGKLLMEACLEAMKKNLVTAAQDMGAAGLISSSFEMISKGRVGMNLYLHKAPLRDSTMTAEDVLLSESQERVLLLVQPKHFKSLEKIFKAQNLPVHIIGEIKKEPSVTLFWKKESLKIDPALLIKKAPRLNRPFNKWQAKNKIKNKKHGLKSLSPIKNKNLLKTLFHILESPAGCSKKFIYRQYDQRVGAKTIKDCTFPFGVIRLPHSKRSLSLCLGGRPHIMRMDSFEGGKDAVFEPAVQMALRGFKPLALTDGLNFGSPEKKEVMSQFAACVEGMAKASRAINTPVVSGNVSFYNETKGVSISPAPAVGMIGLGSQLNNSNEVPAETLPACSAKEYSLYLLSAHQVFYYDLPKEKPKGFYGSLSDSLNQYFIQKLVTVSRKHPPLAVKFAGRFGLLYALARMLVKDSSVYKKTASAGLRINTSYDPFQERLYEAVLVLKNKEAVFWKKHFTKQNPKTPPSFTAKIKLEKLGELSSKPFLYFNAEKTPIKKLQTAWDKGWNIHFKNSLAENK